MRKYPYIDVVCAANQPIKRRTSEPFPPLLARAVPDKNLRDAVFVREFQQSLDGILSIQDLDAGLRFARNRKVAFQGLLIVGGYFSLAHIGDGKVAMKPVGIPLAACDHRRG